MPQIGEQTPEKTVGTAYVRPQQLRVLAVVRNDNPSLGGLGKDLLPEVASTTTLDRVQVLVDS